MVTKNKKVKKTYPRTDLYPVFFMIIIAIFFLLLMISNMRVRSRRAEMLEEIERLEEEVDALENRTSDLQTGILEVDKDVYWEERAREQGFVKEGEQPVVIIPSDEMSEEGKDEEGVGFLDRIISKIKSWLRE